MNESSQIVENEQVKIELSTPEKDYLLELSDPPIYFEHISTLTKVFYEKDNQQIFCVRSNGVGGVIVKGLKPEHNLTFRIPDKGNVVSIKFSPNMSVLGIIRQEKCVEFFNFKNGQPEIGEYFQQFKTKSTKFQDFYWIDSSDLLFVSEQGFEHYQIYPEKRSLKLLKSFTIQSNWISYSREMQIFIAATSHLGSVLNPFVYQKNQFVKLPKFEVDLPLNSNFKSSTLNTSASNDNRYSLKESEVVLGCIYNELYVMVFRQMGSTVNSPVAPYKPNSRSGGGSRGYSEIAMYKLQAESPAKKTNVLRINLVGRFVMSIVDNLIIVHHQLSNSSLIYDIKIGGEFDGYVTFNNPIIKKSQIKPCEIPMSHLSMIGYSNNSNTSNNSTSPNLFLNEHQSDYSQNMTTSSVASSTSSSPLSFSPNNSSNASTSSYQIEIYSKSWLMFLPNVIIDTKLCCFWLLKIRLNSLSTLSELNDKLLLVQFLINRKNSKKLLLNFCYDAIKTHTSLKEIEQIFDKINSFYKAVTIQYLQQVNNLNINNNSNQNVFFNSTLVSLISSAQLPVIEQFDMYNEILYPLVEDEDWWNNNVKYTLSLIVEYFRSLNIHGIPIEHYFYKLLIDALIKSNRLYQLHQYLQYHVFTDSRDLACLLLSLQSTYPASNQLALDMLKRLGTANEEIVQVLLSKGLVLSALRFAQSVGLCDQLAAREFLEIAKSLNDSMIFYSVFKHFEERNMKQRGNPNFRPDENCDLYTKHFTQLFQNKLLISSESKTNDTK